jgi:cyanophycinase
MHGRWGRLVALGLAALLAGCAALPFVGAPLDERRGGFRLAGKAAGPGPVFLGGSGDHPTGQIQKFRELAGGGDAHIVIGPFAGGAPAGQAAQKAFQALGMTNVEVLDGQDLVADAAMIARADGIYMVGGVAEIAARKLEAYREPLFAAWRSGAAIGGTSAGAMVWGERLIVRGEAHEALTKGIWPEGGGLDVRPGLAFLPGAMVDPHFNERARFPRLWVAAGATGLTGIGVDENTAAVWTPDDHQLTVVGSGAVTVMRHGGGDHADSAQVTVIAEGRSLDLAAWGVPRAE